MTMKWSLFIKTPWAHHFTLTGILSTITWYPFFLMNRQRVEAEVPKCFAAPRYPPLFFFNHDKTVFGLTTSTSSFTSMVQL